MNCTKDCLNCIHSFSEPANNSDILHCMKRNGKVVEDDDCCEDYE